MEERTLNYWTLLLRYSIYPHSQTIGPCC